jgi:subtilase family serine protease
MPPTLSKSPRGDGYVDSDIKMYEQRNGIPDVPLQNVYLDGYTGGNPNEDSAADIELVSSMAPGLAQVIIYGIPYSNAGIVDALNEMANPTQGEPLPYQITTSYYFFYDKNVYDALARLAMQGQALFVASGDYGSYDETTGSGAFPPADHPLVTSVGGAELQTSGPGGAWTSETVASFSGGGYSPWGTDPQFAILWWQGRHGLHRIQRIDHGPKRSRRLNRSRQHHGFSSGSWNGFAGTSASAPLWAGFMGLANEHAAAWGRPPVGFANPALRAAGRSRNYPTCYHDIATGNNFNRTNPNLYSAVAGYDLCTGWGSPNGKELIDALVSYGDPPIAMGQATLGTFPGVVSVGGFFSSDDNYRHAIVATNDGTVTEAFFNPQQGQGQAVLGTFPGVVSVGGFFSSDDNYRHAIVATNDGTMTEAFFNPQQGQGQAVLGTFPGIVAVAGFYSPDDRFRHVIVATNDGQITEVFSIRSRVRGKRYSGRFQAWWASAAFSPRTMTAVTRLSRARTAS